MERAVRSTWDRAFAVVLTGGVGTRFWPLSRERLPKQLLDLFGDGTMLEATLARLRGIPVERQILVASASIGAAIRTALPGFPEANLLLESVGRNTAPALCWAALVARRRDADAVLLVLPADHRIEDSDAFRAAAATALCAAEEGFIAAIGLPPQRPDSAYGYLVPGEGHVGGWSRVTRFAEKPSVETAERLISEGAWWNTGIYAASAATVLHELERHAPELYASMARLDADPDSAARVAEVYAELGSISIDRALSERSDRLVMVPGRFGRVDLGSWRDLWDLPSPREPIARIGSGRSLVWGAEVAVVGCEDLLVVRTSDATLVCHRDDAQRVREVVEALRARGRQDLL